MQEQASKQFNYGEPTGTMSVNSTQSQGTSGMYKKRSSIPRRVSSMTLDNVNHSIDNNDASSDDKMDESIENSSISSHVSSNNDDWVDHHDMGQPRKRLKMSDGTSGFDLDCNTNSDFEKYSPSDFQKPTWNHSGDTLMDISTTTHAAISTFRTMPLHSITPVPSQLALSSYNSVSSDTTTALSIVHQQIHTTPPPKILNFTPLLNIKTKNDASSATISFNNPLMSHEPPVIYTKHHSNQSWLVLIAMMAMLVVNLHGPLSYTVPTIMRYNPPKKDTVCVSGGGFSGFWFTLGRLQNSIILPLTTTTDSEVDTPTISIDNNNKNSSQTRKEYYCYSSGCLGVVAALSRYSMEDMWNIAYNIQLQWKSGQLDRYDVVTAFVDDLLFGRQYQESTRQSLIKFQNATLRLSPSDLSSLNIITTVKGTWWGVETSIRTPQTVHELRTMLIQTTWIPLAIGNDLWYDHHMDGAFTTPYHPKCQYNVGLAFDLDLYMNVVNVNLGRDKVEKFWNKGLAYGL
jgi:hypothetical protein